MTGSSGWTRRLAEFVVDVAPTDATTEAAARAVTDTLGVMLAGLRSTAGEMIRRYLRTWPETDRGAWVVGLPPGRGAPPEVAAMVNATLGHAMDFDDTFPGAGHPSSLVLAATLAAADSAHGRLSGRELADAFAVGFEAMAAVAQAMGVGHYYKGWHVTGTVGTFGATAAACRALRLSTPETLTALGIAGSLSSGMQRNFGTTTKPTHSGLAARNGILAAQLARAGASAAPDILDGDRGFFDLYGQGRGDPRRLADLGRPWKLIDPGTGLKKYPCCYIAIRPIDAVLRLRLEHGLAARDVERILCRVPTRALHAMIYPEPRTGLEGKFSTEYVLAAALVDGRVSLSTFTDAAVGRPEVRDVMRRVVTEEDAALRPEDPDADRSGPANGGQIQVVLRTVDGHEHVATETEPHGGPRNPFTWADIETKFLDCARFGGCGDDASAELFTLMRGLTDVPDVLAELRRLTVVV